MLVGGGLAVRSGAEEKPRDDQALASWLQKRLRDFQPSAEEKRFDDIAWVDGIRPALRLAREHRRPVFLFTHDGRMGIGRC
jgi:hypothetical protein